MMFFFCALIACLALWMSSLAGGDYEDLHGKQGVLVRSTGEVIRWDVSPVLTFGGAGAAVVLSPACPVSTAAVASVEAQRFAIQCTRGCEGWVTREREGVCLCLTPDQPAILQDRDLLRFRLPGLEEDQVFRFLVGNPSMAQIVQKCAGGTPHV